MKTFLRGWLCILFCVGNVHCIYPNKLDRKYPVVMTHVLMNRGESLLSLPTAEPLRDFIGRDLPPWNPTGLEVITNEGILNQYEAGKWLRDTYFSLLHQRYWKPDIYALSADTDSCISSAQAVMAGMFPPHGMDVWIQGLDWQPTPVHTLTTLADNKLLIKCHHHSEADEESDLSESEPDYAHKKSRLEFIISYLSYSMGYQIHQSHISRIFNSLQTKEKYNITLPEWSHVVYPSPLKEVRRNLFTRSIMPDNIHSFKSGALLKDIVAHMDDKASGSLKPDRKMWLYTGEDDYITSMLNTLDVNMTRTPPQFSDILLLELRMDYTALKPYYVTLFYKKRDSEDLIYLKMKGCKFLCPLDDFKNLINSYMLESDYRWKKHCGIPNSSSSLTDQDSINSVISLLGVFRRFLTNSSLKVSKWISSVVF